MDDDLFRHTVERGALEIKSGLDRPAQYHSGSRRVGRSLLPSAAESGLEPWGRRSHNSACHIMTESTGRVRLALPGVPLMESNHRRTSGRPISVTRMLPKNGGTK